MFHGVVYETSTGKMLAHIVASAEALLTAQAPPTGETLLPVADPPTSDLFEQARVEEDVVVTRTPRTITATRNPFDADGVTTCTLTVTPFAPCTLLVNWVPYALTTEDPTLILTAEAPAFFVCRLAWNATSWAWPLWVRALDPAAMRLRTLSVTDTTALTESMTVGASAAPRTLSVTDMTALTESIAAETS